MQSTVLIVLETCCECGVVFGMTHAVYRNARERGASFCCTAGHRQSYAESEVTRLARELARKDQQLAAEKARAEAARKETAAAERQAAAQKGIVTRLKNKAAKGLCPCCDKPFADLEAHMRETHPDYEAREESP